MLGDNQKVTVIERQMIRRLDDFDLTMLISEIHDHGWAVARQTLRMMPSAYVTRQEQRRAIEELEREERDV